MLKKVKYTCKDNDNLIQVHLEGNEIDEVWVQSEGDTSWIVLGYNDLKAALKKAKKHIKRNDPKEVIKQESEIKVGDKFLSKYGTIYEVVGVKGRIQMKVSTGFSQGFMPKQLESLIKDECLIPVKPEPSEPEIHIGTRFRTKQGFQLEAVWVDNKCVNLRSALGVFKTYTREQVQNAIKNGTYEII